MKSLRILALMTFTLGACTHERANIDGTPVLEAPSPTQSRLFDCMGENQTSKGNTRADCLPNDADAAARDTQAGSGSGLRP